MQLRMIVLSYNDQIPSERLSATFDEKGGTIGRSAQNHFRLPDPKRYVSCNHAVVSFENGCYYLTDRSTNGTYLPNRDLGLSKGTKARLIDGDRLSMGDYVLKVEILPTELYQSPDPPVYPEKKDANSIGFNHDQSLKERDGHREDKDCVEDQLFQRIENGTIDIGKGMESSIGPDDRLDINAFFENQKNSIDDSKTIEYPDEFDASSWADGDSVDTGHGEIRSRVVSKDMILNNSYRSSSIAEPLEGAKKISNDFNPEEPQGGISKPILFGPTPEPHIPPPPPPRPPSKLGRNGAFSEKEIPISVDELSESRNHSIKVNSTEREIEQKTSLGDQVTPKPRSEAAENELVNALLEALGIIEKKEINEGDMLEFMQTLGTVFRALVEGLMDILRGRTELKTEFRIPVTLIVSKRNNPLKFSPTLNDAISLMLVRKDSGFMNPLDAVREGYEDVKNHELAVKAGMQASLMKSLTLFNPSNFEKKYEEGFVLQKKAKCWNAYSKSYREIVKKAMERFFDEEFVRAYEEQMSKIRAARKERKTPERE